MPNEKYAAIEVSFAIDDVALAQKLDNLVSNQETVQDLLFDFFESNVFFRADYYLSANPDVEFAQMDPRDHFIRHGRYERRRFHPLIDPNLLLKAYPSASGDLVHPIIALQYLREKIEISPFFDWDFLREHYGYTAKDWWAVFAKMCSSESLDGVNPSRFFDAQYYSNQIKRASIPKICQNEFIDYMMRRDNSISCHPMISPQYFSAQGGALCEGLTILEKFVVDHYIDLDPSMFIDLKYINHIAALQSGAILEAGYIKSSLAQAAIVGLGNSLQFHPHVNNEMIHFAFNNLSSDSSGSGAMAALSTAIVKYCSGEHLNERMSDELEVSVIILNYKKPVYTCISALAALNSFRNRSTEIIIIDNGGELIHYEEMRRLFAANERVRIVRPGRNLFFGEGNNIGLDIARGKLVLFLNNDCVLSPDFGDNALSFSADFSHDVVVAPTLLYPNGMLQEYGGIVSDCGQIAQTAKGFPASYLDRRPDYEYVDYASAACLMMPLSFIDMLGGFDPAFEPFYFEDTDLCRRLSHIGKKLAVTKHLRAMHIENASTREYLGNGAFEKLIQKNRELFGRRWFSDLGEGVLARPRALRHASSLPVALIYSPFDIKVGGGERYLLSAAREISNTHHVIICNPVATSSARVRFTCAALGIDEFPFEMLTYEEFQSTKADIDISFVMGNEIVPPIVAAARTRNVFHLQFPFPWRNVGAHDFERLSAYDVVCVNSKFTQKWTERAMREVGLREVPTVCVVSPPVDILKFSQGRAIERLGALKICNVGRFFVGGHSKRQDVFVEIVRSLKSVGLAVEATLVGSVFDAPSSQQYFEDVIRNARELGIKVVRDASHHELVAVLQESDIYLHCGGYGVDGNAFPHEAEHFGITIVEAIAAGCFPIVTAVGGPAEIVDEIGLGAKYRSVSEAVAHILQYRRAAITTPVERYGLDAFGRSLRDLLFEGG